MLKFLTACFLTFCLLFPCDCAKILAVFPTPSLSHQVVYRPLVQELARRGHEILVITPDPAYPKGNSPPNLTEIDVHDMSYSLKPQTLAKNHKNNVSLLNQMQHILTHLVNIFDNQLDDPDVKKVLKSGEQFDLLLVEEFPRPAIGLSHSIKAPVVLVSSFNAFPSTYNTVGAPLHPLLHPIYLQERSYNLSYKEEISSLMTHIQWENMRKNLEGIEIDVMKKHFGDDVPSFGELYRNVDMLLLNIYPVWVDNRPVPENIQYMGGILAKPGKPLPQDLQSYLDSSKGIIYVSFGTNIRPSGLSSEKIDIIMNALSKMPYTILFKWDSRNYPKNYTNIMFSSWFPQADILKHPKTKLFITQGGLQSTDEAIDALVPLLGFPVFGDQFWNVEKYVRHGIGMKLGLNTLTEEEFTNAVHQLINDLSFKTNILKLRSLRQNNYMDPLDSSVWWIEHIIQHGGSHLKSSACGLSLTEYYEVELILIILVTIACIFVAGALILRFVVKGIYFRLKVYKTS